jgi:hypothetical protein
MHRVGCFWRVWVSLNGMVYRHYKERIEEQLAYEGMDRFDVEEME